MKPIRMQMTALGGRLVAGHPNKAETNITVGSRHDVTSDFMKCLIQKAEFHGGQFDILGGGEKWQVTVTKVINQKSECCTVTPEDQALLDSGDYTPEELFGIGGKPSCPKCIDQKSEGESQ